MKLILETDPISQPLTGIGRYTLELLRCLSQSPEMDSLRCFHRGRWVNSEQLIRLGDDSAATAAEPCQRPLWKRCLRNPVTIGIKRSWGRAQRYSLSMYAHSHLYHAPNYRLPPFQGRKIVTFHDLSILKYPEFHPRDRVRILAPAMLDAASNADHIITDSEEVRREVIEYFKLSQDRVTAVPLASSMSPREVTGDQSTQLLAQYGLQAKSYLLFVSTLEKRKNLEGILAAYSMLPAALRQRFPLVLAGQWGWNSQSLASVVQAATSRGDVIQTGYLSETALVCLYRAATALVYPSVYEGFGLPIIEAQGFGLPVLTSAQSCMPEVAGGAALLVDPADHQAIAGGMQQLIEDPSLRERLIDAGRLNASRFSWQATGAKTLAVYREVLAR